MIPLKKLRRFTKRSNRELKYFKRIPPQPLEPDYYYSKDGKNILIDGKDVTPKPLTSPYFLSYPDGKRADLKKMSVSTQYASPPPNLIEDDLSSGDHLKYSLKEDIELPKGSIIGDVLEVEEEPQPSETQLRKDIDLDDLTRDEEQKFSESSIETVPLKEIDDDELHEVEEYPDLSNNTAVLMIVETKTMMLLDISSVFSDDELDYSEDVEEEEHVAPKEKDDVSDKINIGRKVKFDKETQSLEKCKLDELHVTQKHPVKDHEVNATNQTIYDDLEDASKKDAKDLESEVERQKQRLYDMLMDVNGHFKNDLPYIAYYLKVMNDLLKDLTAQEQLNIILKFIKDYEEDPDIEEYAKKMSNNYNAFIKEVKKVRDQLYPLADDVEPDTAEEVERIEEKPMEQGEYTYYSESKPHQSVWQCQFYKKYFTTERTKMNNNKGVFPEEQMREICTYDEFASFFPPPSILPPKEEFERLTKTDKFKSVLNIVENILLYQDQKLKVENFTVMESETERPDQTELDFTYSFELFWEFNDDEANGKALNCIAWWEEQSDIFAAGYGKREHENFLASYEPGLLLIWSVTLPKERPVCRLTLNAGVMCIRFHPETVYCLALGLSSGDIVLVEVSQQMDNISSIVKLQVENSYGPAHALDWLKGIGNDRSSVCIVSGGRKGTVFHWESSKGFLISETILHLPLIRGKIKGIRLDETEDYLSLSYSPRPCVTCITHPQKIVHEPLRLDEEQIGDDISPQVYLVATDDGCVHQCNFDFIHHHLDYFKAHNGPVNYISFSYFIDSIFLTCGADWAVRIWALNVEVPLITMWHAMDCVECAVWSRHYPTLIASISGKTVNIWDLARRSTFPVSTFENPKNQKFTSLCFTLDGPNIVTGDIEGNMCVYHLKEVAFIPRYPEKALIAAIRKALIGQPDIIQKLEDLGPPFKEE